MKKFRFALEGVSKLRDLQVRDSERILAKAREALLRADEEQTQKETELARSSKHAPRGVILPVRHLLDHDAEVRRLQADLGRTKVRRVETAAATDKAREDLLTAQKNSKAVEKLRERRYLEFVQTVLREEQKATDESAARKEREKRAA